MKLNLYDENEISKVRVKVSVETKMGASSELREGKQRPPNQRV